MIKGEQIIKTRWHNGAWLGVGTSSTLISTMRSQLWKDQGTSTAGRGPSFQCRKKHGIARLCHTPAQTFSSYQREGKQDSQYWQEPAQSFLLPLYCPHLLDLLPFHLQFYWALWEHLVHSTPDLSLALASPYEENSILQPTLMISCTMPFNAMTQ